MPIYEYRCASCGFEKEYLQRLADAPIADCPNCGKPAMTKLISAAGFQLKGSGWYVTDFKNGSKPKAKEETKETKPADKNEAAGDAPKSAEKSEGVASKPAAESSTGSPTTSGSAPSV